MVACVLDQLFRRCLPITTKPPLVLLQVLKRMEGSSCPQKLPCLEAVASQQVQQVCHRRRRPQPLLRLQVELPRLLRLACPHQAAGQPGLVGRVLLKLRRLQGIGFGERRFPGNRAVL